MTPGHARPRVPWGWLKLRPAGQGALAAWCGRAHRPPRGLALAWPLTIFLLLPKVSERLSQPGVAIGLAWTPLGGEIMFVEASRMDGEGQLTLTGQLGDVMKESAHLAISWLRSNAKKYHLTNGEWPAEARWPWAGGLCAAQSGGHGSGELRAASSNSGP